MLKQQFHNLTIKQAKDLQKLVYNILQQSNHINQYNTTQTHDLQNNNQIQNFLFMEINHRNTIITELAHMTIAIIDEVMRHIDDNLQIKEQLERTRGELKGYTHILFNDKEYLDLLGAQNEKLKTEIEAVRNQKDLMNFKNQIAIIDYEKQKDQLKNQIQQLKNQVDFIKSQMQLIQSTKVSLLKKQISQLVQNNIKIQEQLQIAKKYLDQIESKSKIPNNSPKYLGPNNTDQLNFIFPQTDLDKFNEPDTSFRDVDKISYNLMAELEINLNTQNKTYKKKQYIVLNLTQRSFSEAQTPTQIRLKIEQQQNEILLQNQSIVTHQQKNIQVYKQIIPLSNKNSKGKNNLLSNSPAFSKKQQFKDKNMSRIKYLLANLGGDNNYKHIKCKRFEAVKKIREQQQKIFAGNKLGNSKIKATLTQATLSPISSVAGLKTLSS